MKPAIHSRPRALAHRLELGKYVIADPHICHGKPTYRGTRIMVWQILDDLARGETIAQIVKAWGGRVPRAAILETIRLASGAFLDARGRLHSHLLAPLKRAVETLPSVSNL